MKVRFTLKYDTTTGLKDAPVLLIRAINGALEGLGKRLKTSALARMREDSRESKRSLKIEITGSGLDKHLSVYSNLIQAFVDAKGIAPRKVFPKFGRGSRLYQWAERKTQGKASRTVTTYNRPKGRPRKRDTAKFEVRAVRGKKTPLTQTKRQKVKDGNVRRFAYLAARKIYTEGIKPTYWDSKSLEANQTRILQDLNNGIRRAVNQINRG